jgi:prepilin-type N-terminal cleavage/methylation domain-containing protein
MAMFSADSSHVRTGQPSVPSRRRRSGFSLLELTVVLILVGIITATAGPRISVMRSKQRVTRAASTIQTNLEKAFAISTRNRAPMEIVWNATTMKLSVTNRAGTMTYGELKLGSDYGLRTGEVTASASKIEVFPNGLASGALTITITTTRGSATYTKVVTMNRAGLVKVT